MSISIAQDLSKLFPLAAFDPAGIVSEFIKAGVKAYSQSLTTKLPTINSPELDFQSTTESITKNPLNLPAKPFGLESFSYTSTPLNEANLLQKENRPDYIVAALPTTKLAGKLHQFGLANIFFPEWKNLVLQAVERNGGLGNAEEGYLAFSKNYGFIRLKNNGLTDEQNRELAAISLTLGFAVEDLPSRTKDSVFTNPEINRWVNEFIAKHQAAFEKFQNDPQSGYNVKDGRRRYVLKSDLDSGIVQSYAYKKKSGFGGFIQKNIGGIFKGIDLISGASFLKNLPIVGETIASFSPYEYLKDAFQSIATGKINWPQIAGRAINNVGVLFQIFSLAKPLPGSIAQGGLSSSGKIFT